MGRRFLAGLILLAGLTLLAAALSLQTLLVETAWWVIAVGAAGVALAGLGGYALRADLLALGQRRRGEITLYTAGLIGVLIVLAHLSVRFPFRFDLTASHRYSLSAPTITMLEKLDRPVHVVFFHDPMMRETVELYELIAKRTPQVTVEFYDPVINPAQARLRGVKSESNASVAGMGQRHKPAPDHR